MFEEKESRDCGFLKGTVAVKEVLLWMALRFLFERSLYVRSEYAFCLNRLGALFESYMAIPVYGLLFDPYPRLLCGLKTTEDLWSFPFGNLRSVALVIAELSRTIWCSWS